MVYRNRGDIEWFLSLQILLLCLVGLFTCGYVLLSNIQHTRYAWAHDLKTMHQQKSEILSSDSKFKYTVQSKTAWTQAEQMFRRGPLAYQAYVASHRPQEVTTSATPIRPPSGLGHWLKGYVTTQSKGLHLFGDGDSDGSLSGRLYQQALWAEVLREAGFSPPYLVDTLAATELLIF